MSLMIRHALLAIALAVICANAVAYDAQPRDTTTLHGSWLLNARASDDVDRLVTLLIEQENRERRKWRKRMEAEDPFLGPDPMSNLSDPVHRRREENELRRMLGLTQTLKLTQDGANLQIISDAETRRFQAGSRSQVSMRNGDLADSRVGWDGEWFVIDRKVQGGAREVEKLRLLKKTDQLEYITAWSGDTELSGVKLRRIFDRATLDAKPAAPAAGPVR
jgi:hypothetical protein